MEDEKLYTTKLFVVVLKDFPDTRIDNQVFKSSGAAYRHLLTYKSPSGNNFPESDEMKIMLLEDYFLELLVYNNEEEF